MNLNTLGNALLRSVFEEEEYYFLEKVCIREDPSSMSIILYDLISRTDGTPMNKAIVSHMIHIYISHYLDDRDCTYDWDISNIDTFIDCEQGYHTNIFITADSGAKELIEEAIKKIYDIIPYNYEIHMIDIKDVKNE